MTILLPPFMRATCAARSSSTKVPWWGPDWSNRRSFVVRRVESWSRDWRHAFVPACVGRQVDEVTRAVSLRRPCLPPVLSVLVASFPISVPRRSFSFSFSLSVPLSVASYGAAVLLSRARERTRASTIRRSKARRTYRASTNSPLYVPLPSALPPTVQRDAAIVGRGVGSRRYRGSNRGGNRGSNLFSGDNSILPSRSFIETTL